MSEIKAQLANAMNLESKDIMEYAEKEDGSYVVILWDFKKFVDVVPVEDEESQIPEQYRKIYQKPNQATKRGLQQLCELLEIEPEEDATKRDLVALVNAHREEAAKEDNEQ